MPAICLRQLRGLFIVAILLSWTDSVNGQCPAGWQYLAVTNACYIVYVNLSPGYTYTEGQDFCATNGTGSQLASISVVEEHDLLMSMAAGAVVNGAWCNTQLLIGCQWISPTDHTFIWADGAPWTNYSTSLWSPTPWQLPDNCCGGSEDTCQLTLFTFAGVVPAMFNDCPGTNKYYNVACKMPPPAATTTTEPTTSTTTTTTTTTTMTKAAASTTTIKTTAAVKKTTTTASTTCCPAGGIWSQWTSTSCNGSCGLCGRQTYTRTCISAASGCHCSGQATQIVACNNSLCQYPAPVCCKPYRKMVIKNGHVCGPVPTVKKSVTASCAG